MSRNYPRFLFSNPQNTKSKGPFVISTIEPIIICKVHKSNSHEILNNGFCETFASISVEFLRTLMKKPDGNGYGHEIKDTQMRMAYWLHFQIVEGNIKDWELDTLQDIKGITSEEE